ncbi:speckle-type POZ protein B-like [Planococcus citri]|uniref:speckle-type POZ protein B-like n=1 Tax=Planococcus citri TaxID=170843 RepID=UPI0031FA20AE
MSSNHCGADCALAEKSCNTQVQVHEVSYVWTIHNFDFLEAAGSVVCSPTFSADSNKDVIWELRLYPNGETDANDAVSLYLTCRSHVFEKMYVKYCFYVVDSEQNKRSRYGKGTINEFNCAKGKHLKRTSTGSNSRGYKEFMKKSGDAWDAWWSNLLVDNKLTVMCEVHFSSVCDSIDRTIHQCDKTSLYPNAARFDIFDNFKKLLEDDDRFADVVLIVGSREYRAHRNILASRSPVLAARLHHELEENGQNRINIKDMNAEIMDEFLRYIYTGRCENLENVAESLLAAADKYQLSGLKMICAEKVYKTLSVENATKMLMLADNHGISELKNEVIKFIISKPVEVLNTVGWRNIQSDFRLVSDVCLALAQR